MLKDIEEVSDVEESSIAGMLDTALGGYGEGEEAYQQTRSQIFGIFPQHHYNYRTHGDAWHLICRAFFHVFSRSRLGVGFHL